MQQAKTLLLWLTLVIFWSVNKAVAVENGANSSFNTSAPTGSDILNWNVGWSQPPGHTGVTGWDYVGTINGASGVYLGNGWVLTAGHVGSGTFTLGGTSYSDVSGSAQGITNSNGTADLTLFQLTSSPNLPSLSVATSTPTPLSAHQAGNSVAMLGYGGGQGETWGLNTVTQIDLSVQVSGYSYVSTDFETAYGTTTAGAKSATNNYFLVLGDSGGGDFIYDSSSGTWQLAGINEAVDTTTNNSYLVQLDTYSSQINSIIAVPEPSSIACLAGGLLAMLGNSRLARRHGIKVRN